MVRAGLWRGCVPDLGEPRLQLRNLLTELGDLATLVDELGGEPSQCEAEPFGTDLRSSGR
jgi:hypothetical protein